MAEYNLQPQELQIPEIVEELLDPISKASPAGDDASVEEAYFKLDMEIGKVNPDYEVCIDLASEILKEKSKDVRVAVWLCFSWFRSDKIEGLNNGLVLLLELLKRYGDKLFPANPVHRSKALHFLSTARFVKLLEREKVDKNNAQAILFMDTVFQQLTAESKMQFSDSVPDFNDIGKVIAAHVEAAEPFKGKAPSKEEPQEEVGEEKRAEEKVKESVPKEEKRTVPEKVDEKPSPEAAVSVRDLKIPSEKDALVVFKKALKYFFQQEGEESKRYEAYLYGISRSLIWNKIDLPAEEDSVTQLSSPDLAIMNTFQGWFSNQNWDKIIPAIELNFMNEDSNFKYWLTGQRYLVVALEKIGGTALNAAEETKFQLAKLIKRFPSLPKLKFENNTPFADEETLKWIEEEVKPGLSGGKSEDKILPPILGEDYEPINKEYQKACSELPKNFEKNVEKMQQGIAGDTRRKGRFLRSLNLATFCMQAKQYNLAKIHLSELLERIEAYQLTEWEPALCAAVWQSTYLINLKLLNAEQDQEQISFLKKQQQDLFTNVGKYDGVLALKLANRNKNKGD
jgi:type VI secretion system protein VasJ